MDGDPWFRPNLRTRKYEDFGDAYLDDRYRALCSEWHENPGPDQPYLIFVNQIKNDWLHLRLLADFMQIGTHPERWKNFKQPAERSVEIERKRNARLQKTKVCRLDYYDTKKIESANFDSAEDSNAAGTLAQDLDLENIEKEVQSRLYVVEDLSRDVIEALGSKLSIEPSFFRAHIVDYAWYNVRDRWRDPPNLDVIGKRQNWIQLRYVTARYFATRKEFSEAVEEAEEFNILRRPDDDISNKSWWDEKDAIVGLTRSRATFWLKPEHTHGTPAIGVLLLDPTVGKGFPLWRGHRNWYPTPDPNSDPSKWSHKVPEPKNFYDDFLFWTKRPEVFLTSSPGSTSNSYHIPTQALLHLVCSEWRTMSDYIKTRLCQIDLEIVKPKNFAADKHVDNALEKLNMWRRFIPLYREMVTETLEQVFRFPCHTETFLSTNGIMTQEQLATVNGTIHREFLLHGQEEQAPQRDSPGKTPSPASTPAKPRLGSIAAYKNDFILILSYLEEYQKRIDRLTLVVTAAMQIEDSRRGLRDGRNLGRLTGLATFFIPFSLIATAFCMQSNVTDISSETVRLYLASSVPLAVATVLIAWVLSHHWIHKWWRILVYVITRKRDNERKKRKEDEI